MGKNIQMNYQCSNEKRMCNAYRIKEAKTTEEIKDLVVEVLTHIEKYEPSDAERILEWLRK